MDKEQAIKLAKNYKKAVAERLPLKAIYLYGSYSKGDYTEDSDIDIGVVLKHRSDNRLDTEALNNIFVRNGNGEMSPISQYLTLTRVYGSESLSRFNLFSAISVSGVPADGYSSGQALKAIEEVAKTALPEGYGYEFRSEEHTSELQSPS